MDLRRFEQFVAIVEEGTFTAAAERLFLAQSSLSASVAVLERELGVQLFERGRTGAVLTDAGRAFLAPARATIAAAEDARARAVGLRDVARPLRVADTFATAGLVALHAAEELCRRHPELTVQATHFGMRNVVASVAAGEVDVALTPVSFPLPEILDHIRLPSVPLALLVPVDHRLAGADGVTLADLAGERFITMPGDAALRDDGVRALDEIAARGPVVVRAGSWLDTISLVRRGFGVTAGPRYLTGYYPPDVAIASFAGPSTIESAIVFPRSGRHPATGEFARLCVEGLGE